MDIFAKLDDLRKKENANMAGSANFIIVGLGNPEKKYENTRHNVGFRAIDAIAKELGVDVTRNKYKSLCAVCRMGDQNVLLMKPLTYMNLSGQALVEAMNFYKIPLENVVVIYDDVALDVGRLRIRGKGSHGGHNGIRNIIELTGSDVFKRIKIGVGQKPHKDYNLADWVLGQFAESENKIINDCLVDVNEIGRRLISEDLQKVMSSYN